MKKIIKSSMFWYAIFSVICIVINCIYAQFSHEVSSNYMTYMFLYPLILGTIESLLNIRKNRWAKDVCFSGILTLTIGSFLQGIFEIAGTASEFQIVFYVVGIILILCSLIILAISVIKE